MQVNKTKFERNGSLEYYHLTCIGKTKHTVEPRLTTTPFIRPPRYYGHILSNQA